MHARARAGLVVVGADLPEATPYVDMTETIVAFAEPLLAEIPPKTKDQMARLFERVIEIWNIWVASSPPWNDSRGIDEVADALAKGELQPAEQWIHKVLAERWLAGFRDDARLVVDWSVTLEDGTAVFRCFGCTATPELMKLFNGTPN